MEFPKVVKVEKVDGSTLLSLFIDSELEAFKGHFDSAPIVPGVVQIQWVLEFATKYLEDIVNIQVDRIDALKFQNVIQPNVTVSLRLGIVKQKLEFSFSTAEKRHSSGKIIYS